jgi:hypothetical protein
MEIVAFSQPLKLPFMKFDEWLDTRLREAPRGAAAELAKILKIPPDRITKMRRGDRQPQANEIRKIESYFNQSAPLGDAFDSLTPSEHAGGTLTRLGGVTAQLASIPVVGYVGAGAKAHRYAVAQGDLDEVPAPLGSTLSTVAVEIRGISVGKMFDRWLAFYDDVRSPVTDDMIGKLCVVGLDDDQVLIKKVKRSRLDPTRFDLESEHDEPIRNVAILWAARVNLLAPR